MDTRSSQVSDHGKNQQPPVLICYAPQVKVTKDLHHCQLPPPSPVSGQSYDSPSSSSPASITNEPPPPSYLLIAPPPPAKSGCRSAVDVTSHSSLALPSAMTAASRWDKGAEHDSGGGNPSATSFMSKIKAFEKMDQFTQVPQRQELQEAHGTRVGDQ